MNNAKIEDVDFSVKTLLLDTHILIWYIEGIKLTQQQIVLIEKARTNNNLYISTISLWEIAMLANKGKIAFALDMNEWIGRLLNIPGLKLFDLSTSILISSTSLPMYEHKDPADRFIITTARINDSYLMTQDEKIISYSDRGYIKVIEHKTF